MAKLSFWHKVAFIANICWLLTWGIKYYDMVPDGDLKSTIIITGLLIANTVNFFVNLATGILLLGKRLPADIPRWLIIVNFLFLLPQFYLFFK